VSRRAVEVLRSAELICCEDTRHTGNLLAHLEIAPRRLLSLHAHNEAARIAEVLDVLRGGAVVALCSDAGTPLVSDPGERLVAAAIAENITVSAVPGPSAMVMALVLSGMSGRFVFEGFLPRKGHERRARLQGIAESSAISIVYEAPGRIAATLAELATLTGPTRQVAICRELTKLHEEVVRAPIAEARTARLVVEPRGEYVLVVAPAPPAESERDELTPALVALLESGMSVRDAVRAVEVLRGAAHREAYEAALALGAVSELPSSSGEG
jgi:16S rRNA (cytidine1402-2'-O)-methyltransferase